MFLDSAASNEHRMRALGAVSAKDLPEERDLMDVLEVVAQ